MYTISLHYYLNIESESRLAMYKTVVVLPEVGDLLYTDGTTYRVTRVVYRLFSPETCVVDDTAVANVYVMPLESDNYDHTPF